MVLFLLEIRYLNKFTKLTMNKKAIVIGSGFGGIAISLRLKK